MTTKEAMKLRILERADDSTTVGTLWENFFTCTTPSWFEELEADGLLSLVKPGIYGLDTSLGPYHSITDKGRKWFADNGGIGIVSQRYCKSRREVNLLAMRLRRLRGLRS